MKDLKCLEDDGSEEDIEMSEAAQSLAAEVIPKLSSILIDESEANLINYMTGATAKSEIAMRKCESCTEILVQSHYSPDLDAVPEFVKEFLTKINRGGLCQPTATAFDISVKCWVAFTIIVRDNSLQKQFIQMAKPGCVFRKLVMGLLSEDEQFCYRRLICDRGHRFGEKMVYRFFNCMTKNLVKEMSEKVINNSEMSDRKSAKLSSRSDKM